MTVSDFTGKLVLELLFPVSIITPLKKGGCHGQHKGDNDEDN